MDFPYAVYDLATGDILAIRRSDRAETVDANCPIGCGVYYGIASMRDHRVVDGELVERLDKHSQEELVELIMMERGRRLARGFDYDFGDSRGIHHIGTSEQDMAGWAEVTQLSSAMLAAGQSMPIGIITTTSPTTVTPLEWQSILIAAGAFRQPIWQASFLLQTMNPIPQDITNNAYWQGA